MSTMPKRVDYTSLSTFLVCRKKYYWRIVRGLVGKKPPTAAEFGKVIHTALDVWYKDKDDEAALTTFTSTFKEDPEDEKRTIPIGIKLLNLYFNKYRDQRLEMVASELQFDVPIPSTPGTSLIGRIDKVVKWEDAYWILDHKTTSALGSTYFYKIKPNMQFDGYAFAARTLGYPIVGAILDALLVAKGLIVPAQLAKLQPLGRDYSAIEDEDINRYLTNVSYILSDMQSCYESGNWYENTESCCDFVECPYRRICKEKKDLHDRIAEMDFKVEPWSPLREVPA